MPNKMKIGPQHFAALRALANTGPHKKTVVSKTMIRALAKLGWVTIHEVKVYNGPLKPSSKFWTTKVTPGGRAALELTSEPAPRPTGASCPPELRGNLRRSP